MTSRPDLFFDQAVMQISMGLQTRPLSIVQTKHSYKICTSDSCDLHRTSWKRTLMKRIHTPQKSFAPVVLYSHFPQYICKQLGKNYLWMVMKIQCICICISPAGFEPTPRQSTTKKVSALDRNATRVWWGSVVKCLTEYLKLLIFNFWIHIVWLRITDEGSLPEMRIWSILLINSDLKWCIHLSKSLYLYFNYLVCVSLLVDQWVPEGTCCQFLRLTSVDL